MEEMHFHRNICRDEQARGVAGWRAAAIRACWQRERGSVWQTGLADEWTAARLMCKCNQIKNRTGTGDAKRPGPARPRHADTIAVCCPLPLPADSSDPRTCAYRSTTCLRPPVTRVISCLPFTPRVVSPCGRVVRWWSRRRHCGAPDPARPKLYWQPSPSPDKAALPGHLHSTPSNTPASTRRGASCVSDPGIASPHLHPLPATRAH